MQVKSLEIEAVKLITPVKHGDERGFFSETYSERTWNEHLPPISFVQENHSLSMEKGTLRGLHFQIPPFAQDKLVRVVRGSVLDVAVDLRQGSATYGQWVKVILSAQNWQQLLVPIGFAHGILTLEPETEIVYKVSNFYEPSADKGVRWDDPDLAIDWGVKADEVILSQKDHDQPALRSLEQYF